MSIDLSNMINSVMAKAATATSSSSRNRSSQKFTEVLQEKSNNLKSLGNSSKNMDEIAHMAQLKLFQGLFIDEEEGKNESFSPLNLMATLPGASVSKSQMIDRYVNSGKTTLLSSKQAERSDIEKMIDQVAERVDLAPELIRSVVVTESAFQVDAESHAGAQGLMQLMPETARELGVEDSFDPQQNLLAGSRYLKQLLDKYDGDLDHALAAYNWGQGNVDRHGLDKMPQETRQYLDKIKRLLNQKTV